MYTYNLELVSLYLLFLYQKMNIQIIIFIFSGRVSSTYHTIIMDRKYVEWGASLPYKPWTCGILAEIQMHLSVPEGQDHNL